MNHDRRSDDPTPSEARPEEKRPRLDLSATKIAAGAGASALAAAVGSKLGVAGTIVGAAVASVVSASAGAVLGHSLERGKTAALKARPVLEAYQSDRWGRQVGSGASDAPPRLMDAPPGTLSAPPGALDATVVLDGGTQRAVAPDAETAPLPAASGDGADAGAEQRGWRDRVPGRKPLVALTVASFLLGTGGVTAYTLARDGGVPGQNGSVFSNNDGRTGKNDPPDRHSPGEGGPGGGGSQHPTTPTPSSSGATSGSPTPQTPQTPSTTPPSSGSSASDAPTTSPSTTPSTDPTTPPTSGPATPTSDATTAPSTPAPHDTPTVGAPSASVSGAMP